MTVLRATWGKAVVIRIRARRVFVLGTVLAHLSLVAPPCALALDPDRRISQYGHTVWRIQDGAISPPTNIAQTTDGRSFLRSLPPSLRAAAWDWPSAEAITVGCINAFLSPPFGISLRP